MRALARWTPLGLSVLALGCGAQSEGAAPVAVTPAPPIASASRATPAAEPSPDCISREARAAVETCGGRPPQRLTEGKEWSKCGQPFEAVIAEDPGGPRAAEAAYASLLCYQDFYAAAHRSRQPQRRPKKSGKSKQPWPRQLAEAEQGMVNAFGRYVCLVKPAPGDRAGYANLVEVKYARARTYFEAERWDEAAVAFRDVAMNHADTDVGVYACQLYLEALNTLGSVVEPPRPACYDDMAADVPRFVELYCKGEKATQNADACDVLGRVVRDIARLNASGR